ncbi:hypothetical protein ACFW81_16595 [Streptomyces angustmyceticus]|uniref:hypothetical protein n=1 Tax=Streptomyces angustmyceticus TaxID=285578 RepID=UPI0036AB6857
MTHEHFSVHPDKPRALSTDFQHVNDRLAGQVKQFADKAENVDDAFGVLSRRRRHRAGTGWPGVAQEDAERAR